MKKIFGILLLLLTTLNIADAQFPYSLPSYGTKSNQSGKAYIDFCNRSDYTLVLKIIYAKGGLYTSVTLSPHSNSTVYFSSTNTFKLKIKAIPDIGRTSYHDGGKFSVTCNSSQYSSGEMVFQMSSYGSGLGPSISSKDFESNY